MTVAETNVLLRLFANWLAVNSYETIVETTEETLERFKNGKAYTAFMRNRK